MCSPGRAGDDEASEGMAVLATTTLWPAEQAEEHRQAFSRQLQQSSGLCGMLPGHECSSLRLLSLNGACMETCSEGNWSRGGEDPPPALSWCEVPDQASGALTWEPVCRRAALQLCHSKSCRLLTCLLQAAPGFLVSLQLQPTLRAPC